MKKFGVIVNRERDTDFKYTKQVTEIIIKNGGQVFVDGDVFSEYSLGKKVHYNKEFIKESEAIICLGGDGTFLKTARHYYAMNLPIIGVNLGTLGFLTEIEKRDIEESLIRIINDDFEIEERMMLELTLEANDDVIKDVALNDIVVSRNPLSRILYLRTYINGNYVETIPGDGIILATPSGSTAYSMSAGGPIIEPDLSMIVITPICPHNTYSRPYVTSVERTVTIELDIEHSNSAVVTIDGQSGYEVTKNSIIKVKKSDQTVKFIKLHPTNFFNVLRNKFCTRQGGK
jgi:NAD+ kinase